MSLYFGPEIRETVIDFALDVLQLFSDGFYGALDVRPLKRGLEMERSGGFTSSLLEGVTACSQSRLDQSRRVLLECIVSMTSMGPQPMLVKVVNFGVVFDSISFGKTPAS
jgi:hypothetical protein